MCVDKAIERLKGLLLLRENGFENALISANEIAFKMNIEPKFWKNVLDVKRNNLMKSLE